MFKYETMREALNERIPEILRSARYTEILEFWGDEEIPIYCYYESLEFLFIGLVNSEIKDGELLKRVIEFMEDMANSEDDDVATLLQVQILEGLFGLDRSVFIEMEKKLLPRTAELLECTKHWFRAPNGYS